VSVEKVIFIANVDALYVELNALEKAENPIDTWGYPKNIWRLLFLFLFPLGKFLLVLGSLLPSFLSVFAILLSLFYFFIFPLFFFALLF